MSLEKHRRKEICIPVDKDHYDAIVTDPQRFRAEIDSLVERHPELFPENIQNGYRMKDIYQSKKQNIAKRRISIGKVTYSIRPSFVLPYLTSTVDKAHHPLFLRKFGVPFWALAHSFGRDAMHWYRMEQSLGRFSLVGTTLSNSELPSHVVADEKHTRMNGEKAYIATTVAQDCFLGISITDNADDKGLIESYGHFKEEAVAINPSYSPETVTYDGWSSTINAWQALYPKIVGILCFLHVFIKIRDGSKRKLKESYKAVSGRLWNAYKATKKSSFSQRVRRLYEYCQEMDVPSQITNRISKLKNNLSKYSIAYDYEGVPRTSNMVDRLMGHLDRHLFGMRYFHGHSESAELSIRGWALIYNFAPSCPETRKRHGGMACPSERINQFRYRENWLENLLVSASLQGKRGPPQNPLQ